MNVGNTVGVGRANVRRASWPELWAVRCRCDRPLAAVTGGEWESQKQR